MLEVVKNNELTLAIILKHNFNKNGIEFFTPQNYSQQLGYMKRDKNYIIKPHIHKKITRQVNNTNEVLFLKSGKVRIDFYDESKIYIESRILEKGDIILLATGGHGFKMLEKSEIIEVKQGPYNTKTDKQIFEKIDEAKIKIKNEEL